MSDLAEKDAKVFLINKDYLDVYIDRVSEKNLMDSIYEAVCLDFDYITIPKAKRIAKVGELLLFRCDEKLVIFEVIKRHGWKMTLTPYLPLFPYSFYDMLNNIDLFEKTIKKFYPSAHNFHYLENN